MQTFIVVGANPRSSSLGARDRLIPEPAHVGPLLHELRTAGLDQAMILTTCDRVEVYTLRRDDRDPVDPIMALLARFADMQPEEVARHLYVHSGDVAVRHAFAVAAALDGTVVGDPHVNAQFKEAYRQARAAGLLAEPLDSLIQAALATAKQVRSRTGIGQAPVSLAAAAVDLAQRVQGRLDGARALLIGWSDIGEVLAQALRQARLADLAVALPNLERAEAAARILDCHAVACPVSPAQLARADVIIACLGDRRYTLTPELVKALLRARRYQPVLIIDAAVPGDVDPAVGDLDGAFVYTLDDLETVARGGRASREQEAARAREIVAAEAEAFLRRQAERSALPVLIGLRRHFENARRAALRDAGGDAERATRLLIQRLLHAPSTRLRRAASAEAELAGELEEFTRALRTLFDLDAAAEESKDDL